MTETSVLVVAYLDVLFVGGFVTMAQNACTAFGGSGAGETSAGPNGVVDEAGQNPAVTDD